MSQGKAILNSFNFYLLKTIYTLKNYFFFANQARAGQVWLIQTVQARLSIIYEEEKLFKKKKNCSIAHKSTLNEIYRVFKVAYGAQFPIGIP